MTPRGSPTGRKLAKPGRGASKRREPSFKSGAGALDVRLSPEDRSAAPASDAARAPRSAKIHSAKPNAAKPIAAKARVEPKLEFPPAPRVPAPQRKAAGGRSGKRRRFGLARLLDGARGPGDLGGARRGRGVHVGRHASAADPIPGDSRSARRASRSTASTPACSRPAAKWAARRCRSRTCPRYLPNAFIAIEDRRFRFHFGIDPIGSSAPWSPNMLHRASRRAARPSPSSSPRTCS